MATRKELAHTAIFVGVCAVIAACSGIFLLTTDAEKKEPDPWLHPGLINDAESARVPDNDFREVSSESLPRAIELLKDMDFVELEDQDVQQYVPGWSRTKDQHKPYLVRALKLTRLHGVFVIRYREPYLSVQNDALGWGPLGVQRAPLVIWLPFKPKAVFVGYFVGT
jgi:hypothetical protein